MCHVQDLSQFWLNGNDFVAAADISIADLLICCELQMLELMDGSLQVCSGSACCAELLHCMVGCTHTAGRMFDSSA